MIDENKMCAAGPHDGEIWYPITNDPIRGLWSKSPTQWSTIENNETWSQWRRQIRHTTKITQRVSSN
jgi:hypothetical protein